MPPLIMAKDLLLYYLFTITTLCYSMIRLADAETRLPLLFLIPNEKAPSDEGAFVPSPSPTYCVLVAVRYCVREQLVYSFTIVFLFSAIFV